MCHTVQKPYRWNHSGLLFFSELPLARASGDTAVGSGGLAEACHPAASNEEQTSRVALLLRHRAGVTPVRARCHRGIWKNGLTGPGQRQSLMSREVVSAEEGSVTS